jgi:hypothetical protein
MPFNRNAAGFLTPKRANHQGPHPVTTAMLQTGHVQAKSSVQHLSVPVAKLNKRQRKMAAKRVDKLKQVAGVAAHVARASVAKAALPAPTKAVKKTAVKKSQKIEKARRKIGFLTFSPFDDRFPGFFESYSPWDARFPYGHVPREFPSFSPFDSRFPVNGHGLFRNIFLAKQEEKAAAKRKANYKGYLAMFGKVSSPAVASVAAKAAAAKPAAAKPAAAKAAAAKPAAAKAAASKRAAAKPAAAKPAMAKTADAKSAPAKPASPRAATQLPAAAFAATQTMAPMWAAFPRFSPMARTGPTNAANSGRSNAPTEQSPLSTMRTRANGGAAASPTVRRPQRMR